MQYASEAEQAFMNANLCITFMFPVMISIFMYGLLLYKVKLKSSPNQVGVEPIEQSSFQDETSYGGVYVGGDSFNISTAGAKSHFEA